MGEGGVRAQGEWLFTASMLIIEASPTRQFPETGLMFIFVHSRPVLSLQRHMIKLERYRED